MSSLPGVPGHRYPEGLDDDERAAWLIDLVDRDQRHQALIVMPHAETDEALDALEDEMRSAFEIARASGRDMGVKLAHGQDIHGDRREPESRILALVHQHQFVGGACVHGCGEQRPVDDGSGEA